MNSSGQNSHSKPGEPDKKNEQLETNTPTTTCEIPFCQDCNTSDSVKAVCKCIPDKEKASSHFDKVISNGVESAVISVIEQSVKQVLDETDYPTDEIVSNLSETLEESVQGVIDDYIADNSTKSDKSFMPSVGKISCEGFASNGELGGNRSCSVFLLEKTEVIANEKLHNWKEAGEALRKALCQLGDKPPSDHNVCSNLSMEKSSVRGQSWEEVKQSNQELHAKTVMCTDVKNCEKDTTESRLAKSMEQSFMWSGERDPMNEMWEEYEGSNVQSSQPLPSSSDCKKHSLRATSRQKENGLSDTAPLADNDLSLAELRQRMRQLVSTLPIAANQTARTLGADRSSDKIAQKGALSAGELTMHRSPRTTRRRHRKTSKSPVVLSDDESEACMRHIPPKLCRVIQKSVNVKVKHNHKSTECRKNCAEIQLTGNCTHSNVNKAKPGADDASAGSSNKDTCHNSEIIISQDQKEGNKYDEKSPESESWHTDVDKDMVASGMKQTESIANFADVESCESEREKQTIIQEDVSSGLSSQLPIRHKCSTLLKKTVKSEPNIVLSSESDSVIDEEASFNIMHNINRTLSDNDSDELESYELPDVDLLSDSVSDDIDLTLSCKDMKSLQDLCITDSSDAEAGIEADDEFECDCFLCQCPRDVDLDIAQETNQQDGDELNSRYFDDLNQLFLSYGHDSDSDDNNAEAEDVTATSASHLGLLTSDSYGRDVLDLMFTNVILHMLSVYPDLLNEQTPPPVPDIVFKHYTVVKVTQSYIDNESSCPICLCKFELEEELKELPCSHTFHPFCIQAWVQKAGTCPVCRHNLVLPVKETDD